MMHMTFYWEMKVTLVLDSWKTETWTEYALMCACLLFSVYWGRKVTLALDSWKTERWTKYALTLCACLLFSVFYQYLEDLRLRFKLILSSNNKTFLSSSSSIIDDHHTPLLYHKLLTSSSGGHWSHAKFAGAVLFGVNSALGYLLMLAVMSFNGSVLLAIVVGLAFDYLLFRSTDQNVLLLHNPCACD